MILFTENPFSLHEVQYFFWSVVCANLVPRDPRTPRTENARALRAGLSWEPNLLLSEKKRALTSPGVWIGNWDKNGIESSFVPLNYVTGSDFILLDLTPFLGGLDHTRVKPVGVDRPTRFKNRFLVSWSLFALRVFLERTIRCVVRRNFCPNSAGFYSGACSILCRPDDQVLCTTHQTRNSSVLFSSCQTSHARVAKVKQKKLPQNCIDKLKLFCNRRSGESQAGLLFFSQSLNAQMKEHGSREIPFAVKLRWKFFS